MGELNHRFALERGELEERLKRKLNCNHQGYDKVIPLRDVASIEELSFMREEVLDSFIRNIPLKDTKIFPYKNARIDVYGLEPKGIRIGQTFLMEQKIMSIMGGMQKVFAGFVTKGVSKMPPAQIYGRDSEDNQVMALYVPPIIEHFSEVSALLDGMHRNYICSSAGTTVNAIHIYKTSVKLPFKPIKWDQVRLVREKPPIEERYVNLDKSLFRDLGYVGIDG
jgi:hypothetical protein